MRVKLSDQQAVIGIAGHAGCGHCNSHNQFVQDDSVGLAAVLTLLQEATGISLMIKDVRIVTGLSGYIEVETESGGIGRTTARRGIAFHEAILAKSVIGQQAIRTHTLVSEAFGRYYGQGIHETPVALQTAIANAAVDSFVRNFPEDFISGVEDCRGSCGMIAGTVLDFDGVPVAVLATVNASIGGIGPNEDLEGNSAAGAKYEIMKKLGMITLPTLIVEGKVYWPAMSDTIERGSFLVRADPTMDNLFVADSLYHAARKLGYEVTLNQAALPRIKGALRKQTEDLGINIVELGLNLKQAQYAQEKVEILAKLAKMVSEDGAGISFMSNQLHEIIGGIGMVPGTSAVLSYVVPKAYHEEYIVPFANEIDVDNFVRIIKASIPALYTVLPAAANKAKELSSAKQLDQLILKG